MISRIEFKLGCRGLLLLARFDASFLRYFDRTAGGARRSFWLAPVILPLALLVYWHDIDASVPSPAFYMVARTIGYAYGWILFPLILLTVGRALDRDAEAPGAITVYNWFNLFWVAFQAPVTLLFLINPSSSLGVLLGVAVLIYSIVVEGFLLKHVLRIQLWQAALLAVGDVMLSLYVITPGAVALGCKPIA